MNRLTPNYGEGKILKDLEENQPVLPLTPSHS